MVSIALKISVPKSLWDERKVLAEIEKTLKQETGKKIKKDFDQTVRFWSEKPKFPIVFRKNANKMSVSISPSGEHKDKYYYIHEGTAPRLIVPKPSRGSKAVLKFQPGYRAATRPGVIGSNRARRTGAFIMTAYIRHPGIKAREFSDAISKKEFLPFAVDINKAIFRGMID